ncbi:hypothetical protein EVAR_61871_1 [Eumeta japonica]|uniref:Uncharacterized protein n=1 Tax=Eumeta variegata TaxID=151549 RepID=A0A4C1ZHQ1_EUMVA|nr:hypothetical protein EVAR_61871_1 [Eumeta japonica]
MRPIGLDGFRAGSIRAGVLKRTSPVLLSPFWGTRRDEWRTLSPQSSLDLPISGTIICLSRYDGTAWTCLGRDYLAMPVASVVMIFKFLRTFNFVNFGGNRKDKEQEGWEVKEILRFWGGNDRVEGYCHRCRGVVTGIDSSSRTPS